MKSTKQAAAVPQNNVVKFPAKQIDCPPDYELVDLNRIVTGGKDGWISYSRNGHLEFEDPDGQVRWLLIPVKGLTEV